MTTIEIIKSLENFSNQLSSVLVKTNTDKNIIFSPFSIQTCISMVRMGAEGETAQEMDNSLGLTSYNIDELAKNYHSILAMYENGNILKIANKIYVMQKYEVEDKFNELLTKQFFSSIEPINFAANEEAARAVNTWVESKTNNLIKDIMNPSLLNAATRLVLVNTIYFKGDWVHPFPAFYTEEKDFYLDETKTTKVQTMSQTSDFKYGKFPNLDAAALEMPYENSDLSMLIILPNSRTGLADLEQKLNTVSLQDLTEEMKERRVNIYLPKFKAEFEVELSDTLQKLGMTRMFSGNAEFGKILKSNEPLKVSNVIHKTFIEVDEKGTEAAADTGAVAEGRSMPLFFVVNHPFLIKNNNGLVFFKGNVQKL